MLLYHYYPKLHGCGTKNLLFARFFFTLVTRFKIAYKHPEFPSTRLGLFYGRLIIVCFLPFRKKIAHGRLDSGALFIESCFARPHNIIGGFLFETQRWMLAHV